jgi:hypothetical protein
VAAGALSTLLVVAAVGGGIYMADPTIFGKTAEPELAPAAAPMPLAEQPPSNAETEAITAGAPAFSDDDLESVANNIVETAERLAEAPKNNKTVTAAKKKGQPIAEPRIQFDDPNDPDAGFSLMAEDENGKVVTTRVTPANRGQNNVGDAPRHSPPPRPNLLRGVDLSKLPPAQRQKVLEAMRKFRQVRPMPPPVQQRPPN